MRELRFIVNGQIIKKDPECDFDNLVPGTTGYLCAVFDFSEEWNNTVRVAAFYGDKGECPPQILKDGCSCVIPEEALTGKRFKVGVLGKGKNIKITTNKTEVIQNGGVVCQKQKNC